MISLLQGSPHELHSRAGDCQDKSMADVVSGRLRRHVKNKDLQGCAYSRKPLALVMFPLGSTESNSQGKGGQEVEEGLELALVASLID